MSSGVSTASVVPFETRRPAFDATATARGAESSRSGFANAFSSTGWPTIVASMTAGQFACRTMLCDAIRGGCGFIKSPAGQEERLSICVAHTRLCVMVCPKTRNY
jgi:hypothetical protein